MSAIFKMAAKTRHKNIILFNIKKFFFYKTSEIHKLNKRLENIDGAIKNGQSRDTGNIGIVYIFLFFNCSLIDDRSLFGLYFNKITDLLYQISHRSHSRDILHSRGGSRISN
jgi:hypothetical protein